MSRHDTATEASGSKGGKDSAARGPVLPCSKAASRNRSVCSGLSSPSLHDFRMPFVLKSGPVAVGPGELAAVWHEK